LSGAERKPDASSFRQPPSQVSRRGARDLRLRSGQALGYLCFFWWVRSGALCKFVRRPAPRDRAAMKRGTAIAILWWAGEGQSPAYIVADTAVAEADRCARVAVTGSLKGLNSSNSSSTYPVMVPSENFTITPSSPSHSTACIVMKLSITGNVSRREGTRCDLPHSSQEATEALLRHGGPELPACSADLTEPGTRPYSDRRRLSSTCWEELRLPGNASLAWIPISL
jgi:hypothetical protein